VTAEQEVKLTQTRLPRLTSLGQGSLGYISPEQEDGEPAHPADDTYSLAVILWQLLHHTLKPPRYLRASLEDLEIPSEAKQLILECLEQPRQKRPQSAGELLQRLQLLVPEEEQQRVQVEVQTLQQELKTLESRLQTAVTQKAAAQQRDLEQQKLRKQQELARVQQQAKDWSRRAGYEEALVQDKQERAQLETAAAARLAKLRQQVEEKRRTVQQVESHQLQPAREELVRIEKSLAEIEGQYVQEKQTQQGQLEQSLRQALAELGDFKPAPRDRFEFEQEYQDRLAREKEEYETQRKRLVAFWQQALQEMEKTLAESHQQTVAVLQQQQATLRALQFEIPLAQLSLQLVDYQVDTQQLPVVLIVRGIFPLQIIRVDGILSIARDPARECWRHADLLLPYLVLRLEQGGQLAVITVGFETPEGQRYTTNEAKQVVEEDKEAIERKRQEVEAEEKRKGQLFTFETVLVDRRGQVIKRESRQARQIAIDLGKGVTLEMVYIPAGTFLMGAAPNEAKAQPNEYPQHQVTLKSFCMGKYPVTQAQWQALMGDNPSRFKGEKRPVENVSWDDAKVFCDRLSQHTGQTFRLPSEAEWEYACRAGTTTPFYFGETITPDLVNYDGDNPYGEAPKGKYREETTPVGSFPPNAFGLYDMHGNVWEWCEDVWHGNYEGAPMDGSVWGVKEVKKEGGFLSSLFGKGEKEDAYRLLRGGSWNAYAVWCRAAHRLRYTPDFRNHRIGLRVVRCAVWTL
jgi:formylglycine-generating enzyme required for sulfatase activity